MQTHLYEHSMMYGDASPHEYRQTLVESYLNHYSKEVEYGNTGCGVYKLKNHHTQKKFIEFLFLD